MSEKKCNYCRREINAEAIKCPYCQEWLNKRSIHWRNPYFFPALLILSGIAGSAYLRQKSFTQFKFSETIYLKDSHKLTLSNILLKKDNSVPRIIGEIENKESFRWNSVEIVVVYMNKNNEPIYLASEYLTNLKPGEKRPFQVSGQCSEKNLSFKDFDHYEIKIEDATSYSSGKDS